MRGDARLAQANGKPNISRQPLNSMRISGSKNPMELTANASPLTQNREDSGIEFTLVTLGLARSRLTSSPPVFRPLNNVSAL